MAEALERFPEILHPATGELLPATPENAAEILKAVREMRDRLSTVVHVCTDVLAAESRLRGAKTFQVGRVGVKITGGSETVWDIAKLRKGLTRAGCPQERIDGLIVATVEEKVNGTVARQLAAANPAYKKAIEAAKGSIATPVRASV
jgi:3-oxoacyl-[acyl-carrier-protein] synthase III